MRLNPKYIQLIGDAFIPVLGFFFWDWNLYFILLFYFLDMLTKEVLLHLKSKKIVNFQREQGFEDVENEKRAWFKKSLLSFLLLCSIVFLVQITMPFIQLNFNGTQEIIEFWSYKEMGIEQGFLLVPLVAFMGYSQYKMEFLVPAIYSKSKIETHWNPHLKAMTILLSFSALSFGLVHFYRFPEWLFVVLIVLVSSVYQLYTLKKHS